MDGRENNKTDNAAGEILACIAEEAGIDGLEFDEEGRAFFEADHMTFVFYHVEENGVESLITTIYIAQPDIGDAGLLFSLLSGNHLWEFSGNGNLSIDRDTGHLCLCHQLGLPLPDKTEIIPVLGNLAGAAAYWRDIIQQAGQHATAPLDSLPPDAYIRV